MRGFEQDLKVLRHVALPPMKHDMLAIYPVEFLELKSVILPREKNIRVHLTFGTGSNMSLDGPLIEEEAFEAEFEEHQMHLR